MVAVAENETGLPAQIGFDPAVMVVDTVGVTLLICIAIADEVVVEEEAHAAFEVMIHVTICPFVSEELL